MPESRRPARADTGLGNYQLDRHRLRQHFERSARGYDAAAVLQRTVADRMLERLVIVRQQPQTILDAGAGTGYCTRALARRYHGAEVTGVDIAWPMAREARRQAGWFRRKRFLVGDMHDLPFASARFDMVCANLSLQWCEPDVVFAEFLRVLKPGGLLMFTTFGPDTLTELRAAWRAADAGVHVHAFIDMHDLGDALLRAGFADPVMDVERFTLTYADVEGVLRDLKQLGARNAAVGRTRALTGKARFQRVKDAYARHARDGRIPATYEVVYGHAWAPTTRTAAERGSGVVTVPLARLSRRR